MEGYNFIFHPHIGIENLGGVFSQEVTSTNRIALYGAGKYGQIALQNIKDYLPEFEVVCFIDDNRIRNHSDIEGYRVLSLEEAMKEESNFSILITNYYAPSVLKKIESNGFDLNKVFFCNNLLIESVNREYLNENRENLYAAYNYLDDYLSKMIFRNMVTVRFDRNMDLFGRTCEKEQYFPKDIFSFREDEVFVDAGAFDGDTIEEFMRHTNAKYRHIYAFEPDLANYNKLLERGYKENIDVYNMGLYCETKEIHFASNKGGSSKVENTGMDTVSVLKFDDLELPELPVTFVKMDIEGSELKALQGMEKMIKRDKPKLAICIYHKFEDLWELPLYIKSIVPEYKLYIRNYTSYLDEIVLYASIEQ